MERKEMRVLKNVASMPGLIISTSKSSPALWKIATAKYLSGLMPQE
jgi:hypothetical protein